MTERDIYETLNDLYQTCGYDLGWGDRTPSRREFDDVMRDQLAMQQPDVAEAFRHLPKRVQQDILRRVGP